MTAVGEVNNDKTTVLDKFIFRSVLPNCFTAESNSMSKLIDNPCTCKLVIKTTAV